MHSEERGEITFFLPLVLMIGAANGRKRRRDDGRRRSREEKEVGGLRDFMNHDVLPESALGGNLPRNMSLHRNVPPPGLENLDFFPVPKHRAAILDQDGQRCFSCCRALAVGIRII
jgi:hypothetical protein